MVLETFVGPCPKGMEACHNNDIKTDNRLSNLRWDTKSNNTFDAINHNKHVNNKGERSGQAKLTEQNVHIIIYMYYTGLFSQPTLAKLYNIGHSTVYNIVNKRKWKHLWKELT